MSKTDRFFEAAMRLTVVCGGAVSLGELLAKYLGPHAPGHEGEVRIACLTGMLLVAVWSQWPSKAGAPSAEPSTKSYRPSRHVKRSR